ncbi:MAG: hypothetical protein MPJ50_19375, partial [Pirellulales bacterium]|nr:hypothetical protein [Pirellulales bacterium]
NSSDAGSKRVSLQLVDVTITFVSSQAITLERLLDKLDRLTKECKRGFSQGFDISTLVRVLRDRAKAEAAGGVAC